MSLSSAVNFILVSAQTMLARFLKFSSLCSVVFFVDFLMVANTMHISYGVEFILFFFSFELGISC